MPRILTLACVALVSLTLVDAASAQDVNVKLTLRSDRVGLFEFTGQLPESSLDVSGRPSVVALRPLVSKAQQALSRREGYLPHIYGESSRQMSSSLSSRVVEVAVTDPRSGRLIHASRQPLRPRPARAGRVRRSAPALMRHSQIESVEAAPALPEPAVVDSKFNFVGPVARPATGQFKARSVVPFATTVGVASPR